MRILTFLMLAFASINFSAQAANPQVAVKTNYGDFTLELYPEQAPKTVGNFLSYVEDGSYVGTQFHRLIPNFVIQGGGFDVNMQARAHQIPVPNESQNGLSNERGTIAMARTADPDSATRQFYINLANNSNLDPQGYRPGYTVFGKVITGFSNIEKMAKVPTTNLGRMQNVPMQPIIITDIQLIQP
ncbi:Peptidyl-prolyl cis-trans isomerase A [Vibrio stylophorae]|uniref:Peptidyl-prolyl cis-trans isomerase n=1 Tax=Vibrio stylophorae TaxID=659351 RepID=A0ABM8ZRM5_9VIBR|nr:peptidylprolyl isomerase [Vibrio stylophorae]CAH0532949.1 Peptidyl-prolyl cis-trans isomerase A [Vibrio stylophorae]